MCAAGPDSDDFLVHLSGGEKKKEKKGRYGIRNRTLQGLQLDDIMDILSVNSPVWE